MTASPGCPRSVRRFWASIALALLVGAGAPAFAKKGGGGPAPGGTQPAGGISVPEFSARNAGVGAVVVVGGLLVIGGWRRRKKG